jgi:hypothetical protein
MKADVGKADETPVRGRADEASAHAETAFADIGVAEVAERAGIARELGDPRLLRPNERA